MVLIVNITLKSFQLYQHAALAVGPSVHGLRNV